MDLIEDFVAATSHLPSPERFRRWSILSAISIALNRNVWTSTREGLPLLPNLFTILVGEAASGKGLAILASRAVLETQPEVILGPDDITHEALILNLSKKAKATLEDGLPQVKAAMGLWLDEWGTFLREPKNDDLAMLAKLYDNISYERETISRKVDRAENPYLVILAGTTPAWFAEGFRANDYEQGLPTRLFLIYSDKLSGGPPYTFKPTSDTSPFQAISQQFMPSFDAISQLKGFVGWTPEAGVWYNALAKADFQPAPADPMLAGYVGRRPAHLAKLAILVAVARHPEKLEIEASDLEKAWEIMREAEPFMSQALQMAGGNVYAGRMEAIAKFVEREYIRTNKPVPEWEIRQRMGRTIAPNMLMTTLTEMLAQQRLRVREGTESPNRKFTPGAKVK